MSVQLATVNAVIVARHFNPSVVNQLWLVENQLVAREDFRPGCVFSDMLSNVVTRSFVLFASPEQLQFTPLGDSDGHQQLATDTVGRLVAMLPHTPYSAAGLNFTWHLRPEGFGVGDLSRALFYANERPLFRAFDADDARFGGYLSKNAMGCRLKLDVKPLTAQMNEEQIELMQFAFNFHLDIAEKRNPVDMIQGLMKRWNDARALTTELMQIVQEKPL